MVRKIEIDVLSKRDYEQVLDLVDRFGLNIIHQSAHWTHDEERYTITVRSHGDLHWTIQEFQLVPSVRLEWEHSEE